MNEEAGKIKLDDRNEPEEVLDKCGRKRMLKSKCRE